MLKLIYSLGSFKKLFTADGIAMSLLRQPIAVSDLSPDPPGLYSYQPTPTSKFSVSMDGPVPALLRAALELNQDIMIMATPWSRVLHVLFFLFCFAFETTLPHCPL